MFISLRIKQLLVIACTLVLFLPSIGLAQTTEYNSKYLQLSGPLGHLEASTQNFTVNEISGGFMIQADLLNQLNADGKYYPIGSSFIMINIRRSRAF